MLRFFKDEALRLEVSVQTPKRFLLPESGGIRTSSLWLGDAYTATVTATGSVGATSLTIDQTFEFPTSGTAVVNGMEITYTGKTGTTLTGIPSGGAGSITSTINPTSLIRPKVFYTASGNVFILPSGVDLQNGLKVSLKRADQSSYLFPGTAALYVDTEIETGVENALRVDLQVEVDAGDVQEFVSWNLVTNVFQVDGAGDEFVAEAFGYALRRDQDLQQKIRVLPVDREVKAQLPGLIIGKHRWRDEEQINAGVLVPTSWDPDIASIGEEKFVSGIGHGMDLEPVALEEVDDSLHLRIRPGAYFSGPNRYYLPAGHKLEFFPVSGATPTELVLAETPRRTKPLFVGTYLLDGQGFYEKDTEYRYLYDGDPGDLEVPYYFSLSLSNRRNLTVNTAPPAKILFLGTLTGNPNDYFDLPIYPVDRILRVYIDRGLGQPQVDSTNFVFDREQGTLAIKAPSGEGVSIPGGLVGEAVFATYDPAVAVLYEYGEENDRLITEVDVNPAFSGVASGNFYLQHRRQKPDTIELSADKPLIQIPPTYQSILGLIAYGPVYFEDDYALLIAKAFSKTPGEAVPGARLQVVVDASFAGLVNYKDPLSETVEVVTGADGIANLVYLPKSGFGTWIQNAAAQSPLSNNSLSGKKTTTITNDTLVLPAPVPISQIHSDSEGWLVTLYSVFSNNPLFGLAGGDPDFGEVPFTTTGTPGASNYKTNGMRDAWRSGEAIVRPIQALDVNGFNYTHGSFNGSVKQLVFGAAIPNAAGTAAYFVTYLHRVTLQLALADSNVQSNTILLQMDVPSVIVENPWLILNDDTQGRLNQYRLGWSRPLSTRVPNYTL